MPARFDGVIEAVRYSPDGKIEVARAYERRGAAFSDHVLITTQPGANHDFLDAVPVF